jgi:phage head maturation protease
MNDDLLVFMGGELKTFGAGEVGGYAVMFTTPNDPDQTNEYFDARTDFDLTDRSSIRVLYDHERDPQIQGEITRARFAVGPNGITAMAKLDMRDPVHRDLFSAVKRNKLGWSSAAAGHLVRYETVKGGIRRITKWPIVEFSLTENPAELRARAVALKSMVGVRTLADLLDDDDVDSSWPAAVQQTYLEARARELVMRFNESRLR